MTWYTLAHALAGRADLPRIVLSTRGLDRAGIDALHAAGDCFVSLSRGEGWGLGAFDAGSHGHPIVVTGWGGTLDMLPTGYPYCVDYEPADDRRRARRLVGAGAGRALGQGQGRPTPRRSCERCSRTGPRPGSGAACSSRTSAPASTVPR